MEFYKETNLKFVEELGCEIPKDWEVVRLEDISKEIYYGITAKAVERNTGIRILRTTDINNYSVNWNNLPYCEITETKNNIQKYLLKSGDLIVTRSGTVGVSVLVEKDFDNIIFGSYLIKIRLKEYIHPKFIHYYFQSKYYWDQIAKAQGSTLKNINIPLLKSLLIFFPPLPEQKKIAEILSTVDQAIQKTDEIIAKTERLKKGLMQELLSGRVRIREEDGRISFYRETRFKDTEIGKIPEDWEVVRLGEVINYKKGKKPKKLFDIWKDTYLPYLTAEFFRTGRPDKFVDTSKETGIEIVNSDDIVLIWDGSNAGDVFRGLKGVLASTMVKIDVKDPNKVCKNFIYYFLKTKFSILNTQTTGSTIPHVSKTVFENLPIPLPPIPEQRKIAEILSTIDKKLEIERKEKEKLKRIKKGLMDVLLTGRVRVKLDVQSGT